MTAAQPLVWFNLLPLWRRQVSVWGLRMQAITADRLLYLWLHRAGLMGKEERVFIESRVRPGMRVIDVGANLGLYSLLLSRRVGPSGHVIALEPDPELFAALRSNCQNNAADNTELLNAAAGSKPGTLTLSRNLVNAGDNRVAPQAGDPLVRQFEVRAAPIDDIVADRPVDFIKIDVQGWEREVFAGMKRVMSANPALQIYFEYWPYGLRKAGCDPPQLLATVMEAGFELSEVTGAECRPLTDPNSLNIAGKRFTNLLATRR